MDDPSQIDAFMDALKFYFKYEKAKYWADNEDD